MEIFEYSGKKSFKITGEKINAYSPFSPLLTTAGKGVATFAIYRMAGIQSDYICRCRRVIAGDEVDVYAIKKNLEEYKITPNGNWIDGSGETFYISIWYDQSGNGNHAVQAVANNQPILILNGNNGYAEIDFNVGKSPFLNLGNLFDTEINISVVLKVYQLSGERNEVYFRKGEYGSPWQNMDIWIRTDGNTYYEVHNGSEVYGYVPTLTGWHTHYMLFDGSQTGNENRLQVYRDGIKENLSFFGTIPPSGPITGDLKISDISNRFTGKMSFIQFFNKSLTDNQVIQIQNYLNNH